MVGGGGRERERKRERRWGREGGRGREPEKEKGGRAVERERELDRLNGMVSDIVMVQICWRGVGCMGTIAMIAK